MYKRQRKQRVRDYRGLGWRRPVLAAALLVFLLSLAGFPPTAGFVGKLYLLRAAVDAGETSLAVTLVLTSLVAYYYYLRVVWKMYFEAAPEDARTPPPPKPGFNFVIGTCVALILLGGLFPGRIIDRAREALADAPAPGVVVQAEDPPSP